MNYKKFNDNELLYMIGQGDEESKKIMFEKYRSVVNRYSYKYYKLYNERIEFCDLQQEGYIALFNAIENFSVYMDNTFYTFVCICIDRAVIAYCKKSFGTKNKILNESYSLYLDYDNDEMLYEVNDDDYNPEKCFDSKKTLNDIYNLKYEFTGNRSLIFELWFNGFKNKEISSLLDIKYGTVNNNLVFIKKFIKERII